MFQSQFSSEVIFVTNYIKISVGFGQFSSNKMNNAQHQVDMRAVINGLKEQLESQKQIAVTERDASTQKHNQLTKKCQDLEEQLLMQELQQEKQAAILNASTSALTTICNTMLDLTATQEMKQDNDVTRLIDAVGLEFSKWKKNVEKIEIDFQLN